jgi:hypothetical protein
MHYNLPNLIMFELKQIYSTFNSRLELLRGRMQEIINGTRKKEVCDRWLNDIEIDSDNFLLTQGFIPNSLPFNYTSTPPANLSVVHHNAALIKRLMMTSGGELEKFLDQTTKKVYLQLDRLLAETQFTLIFNRENGFTGTDFENRKRQLEMDMEYLLKMKEMDDEICIRRQKKNFESVTKFEMTDVVPVGGLIMARFHIMECEFVTAIEIWENIKKKPTLRPVSVSPNFAFDSFTGQECSSDSSESILENVTEEFMNTVLTTCPAYTPESCFTVAWNRNRSRASCTSVVLDRPPFQEENEIVETKESPKSPQNEILESPQNKTNPPSTPTRPKQWQRCDVSESRLG